MLKSIKFMLGKIAIQDNALIKSIAGTPANLNKRNLASGDFSVNQSNPEGSTRKLRMHLKLKLKVTILFNSW